MVDMRAKNHAIAHAHEVIKGLLTPAVRGPRHGNKNVDTAAAGRTLLQKEVQEKEHIR